LQQPEADLLVPLLRAVWPTDDAHGDLDHAFAHERAQGPWRPLVRADQLLAAGHTPGPLLGRQLKWLEDKQLEGSFATVDEALALLRTHGPGGSPPR
jgi:hypothetical protein